MNALAVFSPVARSLIVMAAIAILVLFLQLAAPIVAPMLLAVFIAVVATPPLRWMRRFGMPKWAALAFIVFVLLDIGSLFLLLATGAIEGFRDSLPGYQERFLLLSEELGTWLEDMGMEGSREALLAFLLNFIPFVGALLMMIPPVLLALVQTDLQTTLLVVAGYLAVNTLIGSILEPRIMGRGLGISTLAVFLSLLFWGWVLGTVGVFLSVLLTMALIIALEANPQTRPLAILLGPEIVVEPEADEDTPSTDGSANQ